MDGLAAAWILVELAHDVRFASHRIACVKLHDGAVGGDLHECVESGFAVERLEVGVVVVVACAHAVLCESVGGDVQLASALRPFRVRLGADAGDDDILVADGLVEFDRLLNLVRLDAVPRRVPSAADKARLLQKGCVEIARELRRASELDSLVAHLLERLHRGERICSELIAD